MLGGCFSEVSWVILIPDTSLRDAALFLGQKCGRWCDPFSLKVWKEVRKSQFRHGLSSSSLTDLPRPWEEFLNFPASQFLSYNKTALSSTWTHFEENTWKTEHCHTQVPKSVSSFCGFSYVRIKNRLKCLHLGWRGECCKISAALTRYRTGWCKNDTVIYAVWWWASTFSGWRKKSRNNPFLTQGHIKERGI